MPAEPRNLAERLRWLRKERGLTPVDRDWDEDREIGKLENRDAEMRKVYEDYADRLENHPAYRGYRIARDQGRMQ